MKSSENSDDSDEVNNIMGDPAALEALVSSLPGVDPKSDVVRKAVADAQQVKTTRFFIFRRLLRREQFKTVNFKI